MEQAHFVRCFFSSLVQTRAGGAVPRPRHGFSKEGELGLSRLFCVLFLFFPCADTGRRRRATAETWVFKGGRARMDQAFFVRFFKHGPERLPGEWS